VVAAAGRGRPQIGGAVVGQWRGVRRGRPAGTSGGTAASGVSARGPPMALGRRRRRPPRRGPGRRRGRRVPAASARGTADRAVPAAAPRAGTARPPAPAGW
jgi:hypothetical protein